MSRATSRKGATRSQREPLMPGLLLVLKRTLVSLLVVSLLCGAGWGALALYNLLDKPVALIAVQGDFKYASREQIAGLVQGRMDGGFLSMDLQQIRTELERDPWIESASVGRRWPDELVITVMEEAPIARWNRHGFLNRRGETLKIDDNSGLGDLPLLLGPDGAARQVMEEYRHAAQLLLPAGLKTMEFRLDQRNAWHLSVSGGQGAADLEIEVGQGDVTEKLKRFLVVYNAVLRDRETEIDRVDARYPNGVAVSWRTDTKEPS